MVRLMVLEAAPALLASWMASRRDREPLVGVRVSVRVLTLKTAGAKRSSSDSRRSQVRFRPGAWLPREKRSATRRNRVLLMDTVPRSRVEGRSASAGGRTAPADALGEHRPPGRV